MGFWDSLVDGVSNAAGWLSDHAGDIATAASTIASIGGVFAEDPETVDHDSLGNTLPDLYGNLTRNEGLLKNAMDKYFPFPPSGIDEGDIPNLQKSTSLR